MPSRSRRLLSAGLLAAFLAPGALGLVKTSNAVLVPAGNTIAEDFYAFGGSVTIEGTVEGDLFVLTGSLSVPGTVTGDVVGFAGTRVRIGGVVGGSVRVVSPTVEVTGRVGDDVAGLAGSATLDAVVGRDLLLVAGSVDLGGTTGRDVRAQAWRLEVDGEVGRDVRVKADRLGVGPAARVVGDVIYQSPADADVADQAAVDGRLIRSRVYSPVWARAAQRAVAVLGLLGLVLAGLVLGWVFRGTARRSVEAVGSRPWATLGVGAALLVLPPLAVIPLSLTLVGLPVALVVAVLWLLGVFLGALPAVTWLGGRLLGGRGGAAAALVVGALLWRGAAWALPLAAVLVYLAGTVMGLGALGRAAWALRGGAGSPASTS